MTSVFYGLSSVMLALLLCVLVFGSAALGIAVGRSLRRHQDRLREPFGMLQTALLGFVGLIMAFGLSLAVGRYESRRAALIEDTNSIGTTYLRAQTLAEPARSQSLALLKDYVDADIRLTGAVPGSGAQNRAAAAGEAI